MVLSFFLHLFKNLVHCFNWFHNFYEDFVQSADCVNISFFLTVYFSENNHLMIQTPCEKRPYSELFWSAFSRIWIEYKKMRSRITPNTDTFYAVRIIYSDKNISSDLPIKTNVCLIFACSQENVWFPHFGKFTNNIVIFLIETEIDSDYPLMYRHISLICLCINN